MVLNKGKKIAIITTIHDDWGGSEELWSRSAYYLQNAGNSLTIYKSQFNRDHPAIKKLTKHDLKLREIKPSLFIGKRIVRKLGFFINRLRNPLFYVGDKYYEVQNFKRYISDDRPDLVVISQGINFDGLIFAYQCLILKIPYVIVSQKAVDFYWPPVEEKEYMRETLRKALLCCFVSNHNLRLTEDQFGLRLVNSQVVLNPIKMKRQMLRYPSIENGFRLACIGRFFLIDKGQDILIAVLSQKKWRERPISVTLLGSGPDLISIEEMIKLHGITNIVIEPYSEDVEQIWLDHHALILPSRSEGLPLTIVEAMAVGRTVITTNAGGNAELVEDEVLGFVGEANRQALDETMERAWRSRARWEAMGIRASEYIQKNIPENPEKNFANLLNDLM